MKVEENVYLGKLFDAYGKLLSKGQYEILSYYLEDDLTLSEIAENIGVTRQAVLDSTKKAEKKLVEIEKMLHLVSKIDELESENEKLKSRLSK